MYFRNDASPRLICSRMPESLSSSRSGDATRVIRSRRKSSMCFSWPAMRSSGNNQEAVRQQDRDRRDDYHQSGERGQQGHCVALDRGEEVAGRDRCGRAPTVTSSSAEATGLPQGPVAYSRIPSARRIRPA